MTSGGKRRVEACDIGGGEPDVRSGDVLLEKPPALGARNRHQIRALLQHPGERHLRRAWRRARAATSPTTPAARTLASKLAPWKRGSPRRKSPSGYSSARRAVPVRKPRPSGLNGTRPMPSSRSSGRISVLEVPLPERVFALERRDRVHRVGPPDGLRARLAQAEEPRLPLRDQLGHGADDVLDRHLGIHAVLVQQVDVVGAEPLERALHRLADVRRAAVEAASAGGRRSPNRTWWR